MAGSENKPIFVDLVLPEIQQMLAQRQLTGAREALSDLLPAEIADILLALEDEHQTTLFRVLPRDQAADVFPHLPHDIQEQLIQSLTDQQAGQILDEMDPDDRVEFLEDVDEELVDSLMALMKPEEREETEKILEYPEESIGRLITPDYLTVRPEWTAQETLDYIRQYGHEAETVHTLYMVDNSGELLDHISIREIVLAKPTDSCDSLRQGHTIALLATDDREQAVHTMDRYDIPVLPVVDEDKKLVGIVTFDDVADVAEEEATEDIQKIGGMEALDEPYMESTVLELFRKRVGWLIVLFFGGLLTVAAMTRFEDQLAKLTILSFFVPLIIASGGNSGSQAATLIIRAMAIGEVSLSDWLKVFRREVASGLLMGGVIGVLGMTVVGIGAMLFETQMIQQMDIPMVALTIGVSLMGVIIVGTLVGSMLPFLLRRIGLDPATSSTPFVATIVDVAGLMIYFTAAMVFLF